MKRVYKDMMLMGASAMLIVSGMGSSCPGTGSTANFTNSGVPTVVHSSAVFNKNWNPPMIIDVGAVDLTSAAIDLPQSSLSGPMPKLNAVQPPAVFNDGPESFYAIFNRAYQSTSLANSQLSSAMLGYATHLPSLYATSWVTDMSSFTQLADVTTATNFQQPLATVDGQGNVLAAFRGRKSVTTDVTPALPPGPFAGAYFPGVEPGIDRPMATLHLAGSGAWNMPVDLDPGITQSIGLNTFAVGHDALNNFVVLWQRNDYMGTNKSAGFFNEYRPNLGWRFNGSPTASSPGTFDSNAIGGNVQDLGMDIGFDAQGNGYALYVGGGGTLQCPAFLCVVASRWRGDKPSNFKSVATDFQALSGNGGPPVAPGIGSGPLTAGAWPRILVFPDGSASAFWYGRAVASGQAAELWYAETGTLVAGSAPTPFGPPARFDLLAGNAAPQSVFVPNAFTRPAVSIDGNYAAVAYLKNDGISRRAYVIQTIGKGNWTSLGTADLGGPNTNVIWVDVAINRKGDIAVAYAAQDPGDFLEHVYGNVYSHGQWQGASRLDAYSMLAPGATGVQMSIPRVSIDEEGNAVLIYSMNDATAGSIRRVVASIYR